MTWGTGMGVLGVRGIGSCRIDDGNVGFVMVTDMAHSEVIEPGLRDRHPHRYAVRLRRRNAVLSVATPIGLVLLWEWSARAGVVDTRFFPAPSTVANTARELISDGTLWEATWVTTRTLLIGMVSGFVVGSCVGVVMGLVGLLRAAFEPVLSALYTIPKLAILPLLLLLMGLGEGPRIVVVAIGAFFISWITLLEATAGIQDGYLEAADSLGLTALERFRWVVLPAVAPALFTGLRIEAGQGLLLIVGVEFVLGGEGLGDLIWNSWTIFATGRMYVGVVTVALLGFALAKVVQALNRMFVPWAANNRKSRA